MKKKSCLVVCLTGVLYYTLLTFLFCFVSVPYTATTKEDRISLAGQRIVFVFDMGGVLAKTNKLQVAMQLGYAAILKRMFWHFQSFSSIQSLFYRTLDQAFLDIHGNMIVPFAYDAQKNVLPRYMRLWLCGDITGQTIKEETQQWIEAHESFFENKTEKLLIFTLVHIIFTPELFVKTHYVTDEAKLLVTALKAAGYRLFLLSNWDKESFELFTKRYADFFALFDGMVVSGFEHCVKPADTIYDILLIRYNLEPSECIFIDDQFENVQAAMNKQMLGMLCHDFTAISRVITSYFLS